jgi:hypothetical protein
VNVGAFVSLFADCRRAYTDAITSTDNGTYIAIVITKPPETVTVILPLVPGNNLPCALFDSHSRPQLGLTGAYLVTSAAERDIVHRLEMIFPAPTGEGFGEGFGGGLMEEMYNTIEGTVVHIKGDEQP